MIEQVPSLAISPEKVCFIVIKAREFDAKDIVTIPDETSNASDDRSLPFSKIIQTIRW